MRWKTWISPCLRDAFFLGTPNFRLLYFWSVLTMLTCIALPKFATEILLYEAQSKSTLASSVRGAAVRKPKQTTVCYEILESFSICCRFFSGRTIDVRTFIKIKLCCQAFPKRYNPNLCWVEYREFTSLKLAQNTISYKLKRFSNSLCWSLQTNGNIKTFQVLWITVVGHVWSCTSFFFQSWHWLKKTYIVLVDDSSILRWWNFNYIDESWSGRVDDTVFFLARF